MPTKILRSLIQFEGEGKRESQWWAHCDSCNSQQLLAVQLPEKKAVLNNDVVIGPVMWIHVDEFSTFPESFTINWHLNKECLKSSQSKQNVSRIRVLLRFVVTTMAHLHPLTGKSK